MPDQSALVPVDNVRHPDIANSKHRNMPEERRCRGHKKTGARCQRPAILGGTVCRHHGGAAPHVKKAAQARIDNFADRAAAMLLQIASNEELKTETRLAAIKDILDRCGLSARSAVDVTLDVPRYAKLLERMDRDAITLGGEGPPDIVDGEIVGDADFDDGREP